MPRDLFSALDLPKDDSSTVTACRGEAAAPGQESRSMAKAKTMSSRQLQRTNSPKPSRTGGTIGMDMEALVARLAGADVAQAREAAVAVRNALKNSPAETRVKLQTFGGVSALVQLLKSPDRDAVESAMAALLNLSLSDGTDILISQNQGLECIVEVLKSGSPAAREFAAAAVFTLTGTQESKDRVRQAGGIPALVSLLQAGSMRGKKDASLALFNLSLDERCTRDMVTDGAPAVLFNLLNTETEPGLDDKVVAVLANLAKHPEARQAVYDVPGSIDSLADVMSGGSPRAKEDGVVALFLIATHIPEAEQKVSLEPIMQALNKLTQTGTPRARSKAKSLLELLRTSSSFPSSGR